MMLVQPSLELGKRFSKQRLTSLVETTPVLAERVSSPRERDSGNTISSKQFPGGVLQVTGANSAAGLRSMPVRYLLCDELDAYPASAAGAAGSAGSIEEGDPLDLAIRRTATFRNRKIVMISTPTVEGASRIMAAYAESDQQQFWVPCPHCREYQLLQWKQVRWPDGKPAEACYYCESCDGAITDLDKPALLQQGEWRPSADGDGETIGFWINGLYSPWATWSQLAKDFLRAKQSTERLRTFTNTILAETWKEGHEEKMPADALLDRCEPFDPNVLPAGAVILTAGADVQIDRIEVEIIGWGRDEESWSLGHHVLIGDTSRPDVWNQLDLLLGRHYMHPCGREMWVYAACVDAGYQQAVVTGYCRDRARYRVYATKGMAGKHPVWPKHLTKTTAGSLWGVGVDAAKEFVYNSLKISDVGPRYCHFPRDRDIGYFQQLTAEYRRLRYEKGFPHYVWEKQPGARNEALDCRVYGFAALQALIIGEGWNLNRTADQVAALPIASGRPVSAPAATAQAPPRPRSSDPFHRDERRDPRSYVDPEGKARNWFKRQ